MHALLHNVSSATAILLAGMVMGQDAQTTFTANHAKRCFAELALAADEDGGKLWGQDLGGPMLLVDRQTRRLFANHRDPQREWSELDGVFMGTWPADQPLANTSVTWQGTDWAMVLLPLPEDLVDRRCLLLHESWHRIQAKLGLPASDPINGHLSELVGRYWLAMEWRALAYALEATDDSRRNAAIEDALHFRARRRLEFAKAATAEARLEMHEGLAEYTGFRLRGTNAAESRRELAVRLRAHADRRSLARGFAYRSGPALGLLLDVARPDWRKQLSTDSDLGELLRSSLSISIATAKDLVDSAQTRASRYSGKELLAQEHAQEQEAQRQRQQLMAQLVDGPVLQLSLSQPQINFNPDQILSLDPHGQVYLGKVTLRDAFGALESTAALRLDWNSMTAWLPMPTPLPEAGPLRSATWTLDRDKDWIVVPGVRKEDRRLARRTH